MRERGRKKAERDPTPRFFIRRSPSNSPRRFLPRNELKEEENSTKTRRTVDVHKRNRIVYRAVQLAGIVTV